MMPAPSEHTDPGLFGDSDPAPRRNDRDVLLVERYKLAGRTLDDLPYTPEFEDLYQGAGGDAVWTSRRDAFRRLHNLRKASRLPAMGRGVHGDRPAASRVKLTPDEESDLAAMVIDQVGTLGQRDQLIYDPRLDDIAQRFNTRSGRSLSQHDIWRLIAKLAK